MPILRYNSPSLKMSSLKSTDPVISAINEAASEGDLETLKRLVQDLDDKNPPIGKKLLHIYLTLVFIIENMRGLENELQID